MLSSDWLTPHAPDELHSTNRRALLAHRDFINCRTNYAADFFGVAPCSALISIGCGNAGGSCRLISVAVLARAISPNLRADGDERHAF